MDRNFYKKIYKGNESIFRSLFFMYKDYIISLAFIVGGVIFIFAFLIPQIKVWFDLEKQAQELRKANGVLKENLQLISSISLEELDGNVKSVGTALPLQKEFSGILYSIAGASVKTALAVGDYSFELGELATNSAQVGIGRPSIGISLLLSGDLDTITNFVEQLYRQVPLSEASEIGYTSSQSLANVKFFYKPLSPVKINYERKFKEISGTDRILLNTVSQWNSDSIFIEDSLTQ